MNKELLAFSSITLFGCLLILLVDLGSLRFYHRDEGGFIGVSKYSFPTFFIKRDFAHQGWSEEYDSFGRLNPQVAKYIIGSSLWLHGYKSFRELKPWQKGIGKRGNVRLGNVPQYQERYAARLPIAILSAMTATMVGMIAFLTLAHLVASPTARWLGGLGGVVFFMSDPIIWAHSHRAMLDMPVLFFVCLTFLLVMKTITLHLDGFYIKSYLFSALGAVVFGLALGTKLNAALMGITVALVFALFFLIGSKQRSVSFLLHLKRWFPHALLFLVLPITVFIISNPYLYQNTLERIVEMYGISDHILEVRDRSPDRGLFTLREKLGAFVEYASRGVSQVFRMPNPVIDYLFILLGLSFLGRALYRSKGKSLSRGSVIGASLIAWAVVAVIGVIWWTPMNWYRYYAPTAPVLSVFQGLALAYGVLVLGALLKMGGAALSRAFRY